MNILWRPSLVFLLFVLVLYLLVPDRLGMQESGDENIAQAETRSVALVRSQLSLRDLLQTFWYHSRPNQIHEEYLHCPTDDELLFVIRTETLVFNNDQVWMVCGLGGNFSIPVYAHYVSSEDLRPFDKGF